MEHQKNEALLVLDMQVPFLAPLSKSSKIIGNANKAIKAARQKGIHVIYIVLGFRPGAPEIGDSRLFIKNKEWLSNADMDEFTSIHPDLAPIGKEVTIVKRRVRLFMELTLKYC